MPERTIDQVYGYMIITSVAVCICSIGIYVILSERRKSRDERNTNKIIFGVCIASIGSMLMVLTILFLFWNMP